MDDFFSKRNCDRCDKSLAGGFSMSRFKALPENLASFQMMTEWVEPKDVQAPRQVIISIK